MADEKTDDKEAEEKKENDKEGKKYDGGKIPKSSSSK